MVHLIYCDKKSQELKKIINGEKTMVIRGAAGRKIPHSRVNVGDELYFMEAGTKDIYVKAVCCECLNYIKLTDEEINKVIEDNQNKLLLTDIQKERWHKKCLCLVGFNNVESINTLVFHHQNNMDDWLIIEKIEDVLEGTSIEYNYNNIKITK